MKKLLTIALLLLFSGLTFAQEEEPADSCKTGKNFSLSIEKKRVKTRFILLDLGINSYHNEGKVNLPASMETFVLNHSRSIEVNFHLYRQRIKVGKGFFNVEHGLYFNFNNYGFQNKVDYRMDSTAEFYINSNSNIQKSRLSSSGMVLPLMLHFETHPPKLRKSFHFGVGGCASLRLGSSLGIREVNSRRATVLKDDFSLNDFLLGLRVEMGYGPINLYATYSLTDLFKTGQGPNLTPFSVGFCVMPF